MDTGSLVICDGKSRVVDTPEKLFDLLGHSKASLSIVLSMKAIVADLDRGIPGTCTGQTLTQVPGTQRKDESAARKKV